MRLKIRIPPSFLYKMYEPSRHNTAADCPPNGSCWTTSPPWTNSPIDICSKIYAERRRTCSYTELLVWPKQTSLVTYPDMVPSGTIPTGSRIYCPYPKSGGKYRVTFDSDINNQFIVHRPEGTQRIFQQSSRGLYFLDTSLTPQPVNGTKDTVLVTTVADNASSFSNADYSQAVLARKLQKIIGRPTTRAFIYFIENNLLPNCPVTVEMF